MKENKKWYPDELQKIIDKFYSGELDKPIKERRNKRSDNCVVEVTNNKYFPDKGVPCSPQQGAPSLF